MILRFFKGKNLGEVAAALNVTEAAAQSRVHRALEKLHRYFNKRGIRSTTAIIARQLSVNSVHAAPVTLVKSVTTVAITKGAAASGSTLAFIKGASTIMAWTKAKAVIVTSAVVLLAAGTTTVAVKVIAPEMALSRGKSAIARHIATPIILSHGRMASAWDGTPSGFRVFNHVPLQIDGGLLLWGEGNAKTGEVFPEQVEGIQIHQKFETLYVYHATFYGSLPKTPVYQIVFRYADGLSETNTQLYNDDLLDFVTTAVRNKPYLTPKSPHSKVAGVGGYFRKTDPRPLRFCLTAIENPHPDLEVLSLDLYSCKNRSAAYILAMTAGKSGLMK